MKVIYADSNGMTICIPCEISRMTNWGKHTTRHEFGYLGQRSALSSGMQGNHKRSNETDAS